MAAIQKYTIFIKNSLYFNIRFLRLYPEINNLMQNAFLYERSVVQLYNKSVVQVLIYGYEQLIEVYSLNFQFLLRAFFLFVTFLQFLHGFA